MTNTQPRDKELAKSAAEAPPFPVMQKATEDAGSTLVEYCDDNSGVMKAIRTKMNYVTADTKEINVYRDVSGCDSKYVGAKWDPVNVRLQNARLFPQPITLRQHGYELIPDAVVEENKDEPIDFTDTQQVVRQYYPQCEALLERVLLGEGGGNNKVRLCTIKAFDHNIRISSSTWGKDLKGTQSSAKAQLPLGMVHGDYTDISAPERLRHLSKPPKANDVLREYLEETNQPCLLDPQLVQEATDDGESTKSNRRRRFALINIWRNIDRNNPVEEFPLACMDSSTFSKNELCTLKIHYEDRIGRNFFCSHAPQHDWAYFPQMTYNEALLIKQWDSHGSQFSKKEKNNDDEEYCSTFSIHSSFMDPLTTTKEEGGMVIPLRQSIEVRCAIIYETEEEENNE